MSNFDTRTSSSHKDGSVEDQQEIDVDQTPESEVTDNSEVQPEDNNGRDDATDESEAIDYRDENQTQQIIKLAHAVELFRSPEGDPYAAYPAACGKDTNHVESRAFKDWLRHQFYERYGRPPATHALNEAVAQFGAKARFDDKKHEVQIRVAGYDDGSTRKIYIDMCNKSRDVIKVDEDGWRIMSDPPVYFVRPKGMSALPKPERGGSLNLLREYANVDGASFALLLAFLVQCWNDRKPYPIAGLFGEQGSGKSTLTKMIRSIVDPAAVPTRSLSKGERDLMISTQYDWLLAYDNSSKLNDIMSDVLCRIATGNGYGTRGMYKNREEEIFQAARPVVINGIDEVIDQSDLASRSLFIHLNSIPEDKRRTERRIWDDFEKDRPYIIGALLDAVSTALSRLEGVELDSMPRMADFAEWAVAAESALPIEEGAFMLAYQDNQADAASVILGNNEIALTIRNIIKEDENSCWEGTTEELRKEIKTHLQNPSKDFPPSPQAMTAELRRILPALQKVGIKRKDDIQHEKKRAFRLYFDK